MSQPSVASFFNTRKRAAEDVHPKKVLENPLISDQKIESIIKYDDEIQNTSLVRTRTRAGRTLKRGNSTDSSDVAAKKIAKTEHILKQPKLVQFVKKGALSPCKTMKTLINTDLQQASEANINMASDKLECGMKTPVKQIIKENSIKPVGAIKAMMKKELNFDEVKLKISRSEKLHQLKASLNRIQELEKTRKSLENKNRRLREGAPSSVKQSDKVTLKEFDTIELEVLTSPVKNFKTPTKQQLPSTPDKNELMSPKHTQVAKRILFSPTKDGSPSKLIIPPAYERFSNLSQASSTKPGSLPLPFKYRQLIEIFKALDSVCAMFYNRRECITFKKLKPAVQRMLRKNFNESHLAQIKHLYPEAFIFSQMKMRNYGSASKADYFQLVIAPNVEGIAQNQKLRQIDEDNVLKSAQANAMNPQIIIERMQKFQQFLLNRVKDEHDRFLKALDPPLIIPKDKVTRWHPEFDLENCADIPLGHLPQPPNVEKYSSARDILSTARNLFNCATPMERVLERYEAKIQNDRSKLHTIDLVNKEKEKDNQQHSDTTDVSIEKMSTVPNAEKKVDSSSSSLLKGVPNSLLERIRAKQAAKALDAMTRRPSQDQEAAKYSRLPELARHLRNVFITEKKGVLTLEIVIKKIQNSFRTSLTPQDIEYHLKILAKECPHWIQFHEVRKTFYLKISKDIDLNTVIDKLEKVASDKSK